MDDKSDETKPDQDDQDKQNWQQISARWMGIGFEFIFVVGGFSWLGNLLDKKSDTSPGFLIMGFFVGFITMLYIMIKRAGGIKW